MKLKIILIFAVLILLVAAGGVFLNRYKIADILPEIVLSTSISAVIVPHHDIAKDYRSDTFKKVSAKTKPSTIILVSTNHFDAGNSDIAMTKKEWNLDKGKILSNDIVIDKLVDDNTLQIDETAFSREHGITNILPDILTYFPNANIIPIVIKPGVDESRIKNLESSLKKECQNCLLISSVDFSHYQPGELASLHDQFSIKALENMDEAAVQKAETDSPETLLLTLLWAESHDTKTFVLDKNTNSGEMSGEPDAESTSYVLGYFESGKANMNDDITFMIGGDMMLGRAVAWKFDNDVKKAFTNLGDRVFRGTDVAIANLEGPVDQENITPNPTADNLIFNLPFNAIAALKYLKLDAVSLGNNHSENQGRSGLDETRKLLSDAGIVPIGSQTKFNENNIAEFGTGDTKLSILTINELSVSTDLSVAIKTEKNKGNLVLVFPHWGGEYQTDKHASSQTRLAHAWIDAGADIIIGSHPHVVQDAEIYKDKFIFYSLGNLVFDQTFSQETQEGMILGVALKDESVKIVLLPTQIKGYQVELKRGDAKFQAIKVIKESLKLPIENTYGYDTIVIDK